MVIANTYAELAVDASAQVVRFTDRQDGSNTCRQPGTCAFASVKQRGRTYSATRATYADGRLTLGFGESDATAVLEVVAHDGYFVVEVISATGDSIEEFVFVDIPLTLTGGADEAFAACALALNLQTRVQLIPQASSRLRASCYPRFGLAGARVALAACPQAELRRVLQDVVTASPEVPRSPIGGPWALDGPGNYGSYLFDFGDLTEDTVDDWIELARDLGVTQIDFHGGRSFRFGDFLPAADLYPNGVASMKAVLDRLHAAGIQAGLHTYAMFINKSGPMVTPVPDPRLGVDATFTLAQAMSLDVTALSVVESTADMSCTTGFGVRNSVTLRIDDELITYAEVSKQAPFGFGKCTRGACGTTAASHEQGAKVHHLRECFGLFCPDGESTLFTEVAAKTAELYNGAGFDMIYLDALDGGDTVAGRENAWHYESKFTWELWKRLKKPAIMEMSTFHHHLWYVRSRMGAWDHPNRSHKKFVDIHCAANSRLRREFLPGNLGWWAFKTWHGATSEPTHTDDIEYLCTKALAHNHGLSLMGINPTNRYTIPALPRLAAITRRYECLRQANYFDDAVRERLRVPGEEVELFLSDAGEWRFRSVTYDRHQVQGLDGWSDVWTLDNRYAEQPLRLRLEALLSAGPYEAEGNIVLADFGDAAEFSEHAAQRGVTAQLTPSTVQVKAGPCSGLLTATNTTGSATGAWCKFSKTFTPPVDLSRHQALGVWVYGDGKGEVLNVQQTCPTHITGAYADHYIVVDFTGWRYFELVEPEGKRHADYSWPYGHIYSIYRESIRPNTVMTLSLWLNNIPPNETVTCYVSPIRALPTAATTLRNPALSIGGRSLTFPVEIETGQFLEFRGANDCRLYGPQGEDIRELIPPGDVPVVAAGGNAARFSCEARTGVRPRAYVSVMTHGETFGGRNPPDQIRWEYLRREVEDPRVVCALDGVQNQWDVICRADAKTVRLEAEIVVDDPPQAEGASDQPTSLYSRPDALSLEAFDTLEAFADTPNNQYLQYVVSGTLKGISAAPGVTHDLSLSSEVVKHGRSSARYTATSENPGGWCARGKRFDPPVDLSAHTHIGFLIHGDGNGEILYLQLRDTSGAWYDMKVGIGFTGWKYREFALAGATCDLGKIEYLIVYYNALPSGKTCTCYLDDIRALRDPTCLRDPALEVAGGRLVLPTPIRPGERLVYTSAGDCTLRDADGKVKCSVTPAGALPGLKPGRNRITFGLDAGGAEAFRVRVQLTKVYE